MKINTKILLSLLLAALICTSAQANDILAIRIDVAFHQTPVAQALDEVAQKGHFQWSYNAGILENGRLVNLMARQQTIREILYEILGDEYTFKQNGEYLILKKVNKKPGRISGYLSDKKSGKKVPNATIYDRNTLVSTTTDENGYYELEVSPKRAEIVVATIGYRDTVLQVNSQTPRFLKIEMLSDSVGKPLAEDKPTVLDDLNYITLRLQQLFQVSKQRWNIANTAGDSLERKFQCSFLPNIGTNRYMSGAFVNDYSLNILAGYSRGNKVLEIGGIGNIIRGNVKGVQVGGVFNTVNDSVVGVQVGGVFNLVGKKVKGTQIGGVFNAVSDTVSGVQVGGVFNMATGEMTGVQIGGVFNTVGRQMKGTQIGGILNVVNGTLTALQIGGLVNYARKAQLKSTQISGLINTAYRGNAGLQIAGLINVADSVGLQISGMVNRSRHVKGMQIGLINTATTVEGIQIGLLNFSRNGYIALEVSTNEIHRTNITLKTGVARFYTIITGGFSPGTGITENEGIWSSGIGLGTYFFSHKSVGLTLEAVHRHLNEGYYTNGLQEWEQFIPALNLRSGKRLQLAVGPTFNLLIAKNSAFKNKVVPDGFPDYNPSGNDRLRYWLGGTLAVSFVF